MTPREQLLAALEVERFQPTPPHRVLPAEAPGSLGPGSTGSPDSPGRCQARLRLLNAAAADHEGKTK